MRAPHISVLMPKIAWLGIPWIELLYHVATVFASVSLSFSLEMTQCFGNFVHNFHSRSMVTTYNLYIPGPYENFAEQATEAWGNLGNWSRKNKKQPSWRSVGPVGFKFVLLLKKLSSDFTFLNLLAVDNWTQERTQKKGQGVGQGDERGKKNHGNGSGIMWVMSDETNLLGK